MAAASWVTDALLFVTGRWATNVVKQEDIGLPSADRSTVCVVKRTKDVRGQRRWGRVHGAAATCCATPKFVDTQIGQAHASVILNHDKLLALAHAPAWLVTQRRARRHGEHVT